MKTMKQASTIDFTTNVTTGEAFVYIGRFAAVIFKNMTRPLTVGRGRSSCPSSSLLSSHALCL